MPNGSFAGPGTGLAAANFINYVLSFAADEMRFINAAKFQGKSLAELAADVRGMFVSFPDQYPTMFQLADFATNPDMDKQFQFGLQVLMDGLKDST